ncbi:4-(cytidine 5'-diphospho)-2-C-methyl-D-erythritol kinase [Jiangella asiatica]|uniref:4-(cytidine 5'-diphospho)-2-C-methyl-D-erythritol kinase n=1 Tax=Jiangella asiatica TaxID=2530372 RepID=UPI001EF0449B|nr:4-(cytidine 5'-diphospho)-2-C-methyl-D-erythritol kinase [Jiangella asiatica]
MLQVIARVPAKINLLLAVGPVRPDGFHELATVFHAVSLYDEVTGSSDDGVSVTLGGPYGTRAPDGDENLAVLAARALARRARPARPPGVRLGIHKEIPVASGLAGGSADAAGALLVCNQLWGLRLSDARLAIVAASLGSDVPFSLTGGTAVGTGRGERLRPVPVGGPLHWVLAFADGELSTPQVYRRLDELRAERSAPVPPPAVPDDVLAALAAVDAPALAGLLHNDLQEAALALRPSLSDTLRAGDELGALAGLVSGSGPTCAFLARDDAHAAALASGLAESGTCAGAVAVVGPAPLGT